jgi:hypothetical protein
VGVPPDAACPPHFLRLSIAYTTVLLGLNFGVSREFPSNFADRDPRDSSDHCSTN